KKWLGKLGSSSISRLSGWSVYDSPARGTLVAECGADHATLHYDRLILATGARELFLPFPGWTLPNVFGAGGLDAMVRGGLPIAGKRVVVAGTGPLLPAVAAHVAAKGADILAICEQASLSRLARLAMHALREPAKLWQGGGYGRAVGLRLRTGCRPGAAKRGAR